ncbi:MAG: hypothetical protein ABSF77_02535 [Spirochaetia bacterium]
MRAIVYDSYGSPSVLILRDVEKPAPAEDEILIKVRASSINSSDDRRMRANPFFIRFMAGGLFRPKMRILGADAAGTVEAIGASGTGRRTSVPMPASAVARSGSGEPPAGSETAHRW